MYFRENISFISYSLLYLIYGDIIFFYLRNIEMSDILKSWKTSILITYIPIFTFSNYKYFCHVCFVYICVYILFVILYIIYCIFSELFENKCIIIVYPWIFQHIFTKNKRFSYICSFINSLTIISSLYSNCSNYLKYPF